MNEHGTAARTAPPLAPPALQQVREHLPEEHRRALDTVLAAVAGDDRLLGAALSGSAADGTADRFSDLDVVVVVAAEHHEQLAAERSELVASWLPVLAAFTGEHVGEPRLIIALVGPPLLHVDVKSLSLPEWEGRRDEPVVLLDPAGRLAASASSPTGEPAVDLQWIEDRSWVRVHCAATKLGRGELLEVAGFLAFLREDVLGPLLALRHARPVRGVRRLEQLAAVDPAALSALHATVRGPGPREGAAAVLAAVALYAQLRDAVVGTTGVALRRRQED
ncbi:nucleotidyltransferase domain-containing protein [Kineococcus indalonis]|uniref:nucleotidyltransferase domain-containing protein n=1 Tax=Kineococcus indalonis TaxID=2696566 RepID=UPI00196AC04A|nr:nucleotidyltransferase domain-containing protein [Kineococcus indalonis]